MARAARAAEGDPPVPPPAREEIDFEAFQAIVGPIRALTPAEAGGLFDGAPFRWWVAGGWSVDTPSDPRRFHEDIELAIPRRDLPALRTWLHDYHLWDTHMGALRHLPADALVQRGHEQLWLRRDGFSPWLADLMLTPVRGNTWFYKRDRRVRRPLDLVIRIGPDGIPYQRPEITLLFKARRRWDKDEADFAATFPDLDETDRVWLRNAIALTEPAGHPWLEELAVDDPDLARVRITLRQ